MTPRRAGFLFISTLVALGAGAAVWFAVMRGAADRGSKTESPKEAQMTNPTRPEFCDEIVFEGTRAILCTVDPAAYDIRLVYRGSDGTAYGSVARAAKALAADGVLLLAMNAGMYHADLTPVGLYVEEGAELAPLATGDGFGNFYLKPNGVFFIQGDGRAGIMPTEDYQKAGIAPAFATQSGPMLVIGGAIHPRFLPDGTSKYIRNGVGVRADGQVVFVITRDPLSLGSFARLFKDAAKCPDALFFDGGISSLAWGDGMEIDSGEPAGPVVAVLERPRPEPGE